MEGVIEVSGLERRFGSFKAVDGIDLHVERGEAFGLLGPNGAGKTTTMRMIMGILAPTAGDVQGESPSLFGSDRKAPDLLHIGSRNRVRSEERRVGKECVP